MTASLSNTINALDLAKVTGGKVLGALDAPITRARADSRICRSGDLYVSLPGNRVDGNHFIESAWENGASVALASHAAQTKIPPAGKALVCVDDALLAIQKLAKDRRAQADNLDVIGVTGSNGKTTTKNNIAAILQHWQNGDVLVTPESYNSDIGIPLTLVDLRAHHKIAVLEMGMNYVGEMKILSEIVRPRVSVITNIGMAHVGMLGSIEAIAREKKHILDGSDEKSVAVIAFDNPWSDVLLDGFAGQVRLFGCWGENGWVDYRDLGADGYVIRRFDRSIKFALPGYHNLLNAMAAVEAALALDVPESSICAGLQTVKAANMRSQIIKGEITVLKDCYNSSPESLDAAMELFVRIPVSGRRIFVLGELLELGSHTETALENACRIIRKINPDAVFLFGETMVHLRDNLIASQYEGSLMQSEDIDELKSALSEFVRPGDGVLMKGSRGSALERVDDVLLKVGCG